MGGQMPDDLENKMRASFAKLGLDAKIKISEKLADVEFCSSIFVPIIKRTLEGHQKSYTMIAKLGKFMLKFNKVNREIIAAGRRTL